MTTPNIQALGTTNYYGEDISTEDNNASASRAFGILATGIHLAEARSGRGRKGTLKPATGRGLRSPSPFSHRSRDSDDRFSSC
jgi:hypothetical protein